MGTYIEGTLQAKVFNRFLILPIRSGTGGKNMLSEVTIVDLVNFFRADT